MGTQSQGLWEWEQEVRFMEMGAKSQDYGNENKKSGSCEWEQEVRIMEMRTRSQVK